MADNNHETCRTCSCVRNEAGNPQAAGSDNADANPAAPVNPTGENQNQAQAPVNPGDAATGVDPETAQAGQALNLNQLAGTLPVVPQVVPHGLGNRPPPPPYVAPPPAPPPAAAATAPDLILNADAVRDVLAAGGTAQEVAAAAMGGNLQFVPIEAYNFALAEQRRMVMELHQVYAGQLFTNHAQTPANPRVLPTAPTCAARLTPAEPAAAQAPAATAAAPQAGAAPANPAQPVNPFLTAVNVGAAPAPTGNPFLAALNTMNAPGVQPTPTGAGTAHIPTVNPWIQHITKINAPKPFDGNKDHFDSFMVSIYDE
ncbi:hypothetical protein BJ165DRAFT_1535693 [Panaeolus papilionaceus]|nr:hypothetical protein BJ165DRAFT_1535693 [Panaeolus papilionaceus]